MDYGKENKKIIIQSATRLFSRYGKAGVSMADIARESGVNKALIYYHFRNKEDLYRLIFQMELKKMVNELHDGIFQRNRQNNLPRMLIENFVWYWQQNPAVLRLLIYEINSGADLLIKLIRTAKTDEISHKIYNIFKLVDATFSGKIDDANARVQRFINFMGLTMIYFLLEPFYDRLFDIPEELQQKFVEKRIDALTEMMQYLKKRDWF